MNVQERNVYFTVNMARASAKKASKPEMVQALGLGGLRSPSPPGTVALRAKEHLAIAPPAHGHRAWNNFVFYLRISF